MPLRCRADRRCGSKEQMFFWGCCPQGDRYALGSTRDPALWARSSAGFLLGGPAFDLGTKPELHAARSQVEGWLRHVGVPPLILGHGVAVREAKDFGDALCVEKIRCVDLWGHAG
jgi:hypothetical protein